MESTHLRLAVRRGDRSGYRRRGPRHRCRTDLNPPWSEYSQALGASEVGIVGYTGSSLYGRRALYWSGADPSHAIDLHQFLPSDYISSYAVAINDAKAIAGTAIKSNGERYAVVWRPVHQFSLMFGPGFIRAGQITNAYVTLEKPAPKGGLVIRLTPTSTDKSTSAWSLQQEVVIAAGKTSAVVRVATSDRKLLKPVRATISATLGTVARQVTLTINPGRPRRAPCPAAAPGMALSVCT